MSGSVSAVLSAKMEMTVSTIHWVLCVLFFCSGCSALIYQVMWQRMLFTLFGVDLVSTSVIIAVFMFGLGVGGMIGGRIADRMPSGLLALYIAIEFIIALFGFISPSLIDCLGNRLFYNSELVTAMVSFVILAIPTILMGATFPLLVMHVNRYKHNMGDSVGGLYFVNTLGGAMGAYLGGFVLLYSMDTAGAIDRAAMLNLLIATVAFIMFRRSR